MKVVALVSGGKDSCFAMMECVRLGHEISVLAHLHPPLTLSPDEIEIDSFMFQSVGYNVVDLIAKSMELPLIKETITGTAKSTDMQYTHQSDDDEVEDLYRLLRNVKKQYPDIEGVCTGAIFSSYQRNRVENVCSRLGLLSLAYLWRRNQEELLNEMIDSGMEVILIKVASIGLHPKRHLGRTIKDLQSDLLTLHENYQLNVCGEGGEYESLTLDCPLFKQRIVLDETRIVIHSDDSFAPVAFLAIESCHLEDKDFTKYSNVVSTMAVDTPITQFDDLSVNLPRDSTKGIFRDQLHLSGIINNISCQDHQLELEDEVENIFQQLELAVQEAEMTLQDVTFVHVYVRKMEYFAIVNKVYGKFFCYPNPPSRSCVGLSALHGSPFSIDSKISTVNVLLDAYVIRNRHAQTQVLHVKSRSRWAPHCIGPYSQANGLVSNSIILLAGQIALLPETMELIQERSHEAEMMQCFKNATRVLDALDTNLTLVCCAVIYYVESIDKDGLKFDSIQLILKSRDIMIRNAYENDIFFNDSNSDESDDEVSEAEKEHKRLSLVRNAPLLLVQVNELPRNSLIEVELQVFSKAIVTTLLPSTGVITSESFFSLHNERKLKLEIQYSVIPHMLCHLFFSVAAMNKTIEELDLDGSDFITNIADLTIIKVSETMNTQAQLPWNRILHFRIFMNTGYFTTSRIAAFHSALRSILSSQNLNQPAITIVPVPGISGTTSLNQVNMLAIQVTAQDIDLLESDLWICKKIS